MYNILDLRPRTKVNNNFYICKDLTTHNNSHHYEGHTIPFEFSMENCSWFDNCGIRQYTVQVELSDEEAQNLSCHQVHHKLEEAVKNECKRIRFYMIMKRR